MAWLLENWGINYQKTFLTPYMEYRTMDKWVILNSNGKFVRKIHNNQTSNISSFCLGMRLAEKFDSRDDALQNCCGNQKPISMSNYLCK